MDWKRFALRFFRRRGFNVTRYGRANFLEHLAIRHVYDVGANVGQFALGLRDCGYRGRICSFEPMAEAFAVLQRRARRDPEWEVRHCAVGDRDTESVINVSGNSYSSSLMTMLPRHIASEPASAPVRSETVQVRRLDDLHREIGADPRHLMLKVDTQGYETQVLDGCPELLAEVPLVQLEMSLEPLYQGAPLFDDLYRRMVDVGFHLTGVDSGFLDRSSGRTLQVDALFERDHNGASTG